MLKRLPIAIGTAILLLIISIVVLWGSDPDPTGYGGGNYPDPGTYDNDIFDIVVNPFCEYDLDNNGLVDSIDTSLVSNHWHHSLTDTYHDDIDNHVDYNSDGAINVADIMEVNANYGDCWVGRIVQSANQSFMSTNLNTEWGHNWTPSWVGGFDYQVFKTTIASTTWKDPYDTSDPVNYSGSWLVSDLDNPGSPHPSCSGASRATWNNSCIRSIAHDHPNSWWILGEEVNFWTNDCPNSKFEGEICPATYTDEPSPKVYARWVYEMRRELLAGWVAAGQTSRIVGFYFAQDDIIQAGTCGIDYYTLTEDYLDDFWTEWSARGWGSILPFDAVDYNHRPTCRGFSSSYWDTQNGGIAKSAEYWCGVNWESQCGGNRSDGKPSAARELADRNWLQGKSLWIETMHGYRYCTNYNNCSNARIENPSQYSQDLFGTAQRMKNLLDWAETHPVISALLWYNSIIDLDVQKGSQWSSLYKIPIDEPDGVPYSAQATEGDLTCVGETFRDNILTTLDRCSQDY